MKPPTARVAVVIPCYRVERAVRDVVLGLPSWVAAVIAVDDACPNGSGEVLDRLAEEVPKLRVLHHAANRGVGGAMATGFQAALELDVDVIVKMDGDGQMDPSFLPALIEPLLDGRADYTKGNRLRSVKGLQGMPWSRLFGNVALTFLTKVASGCWHVMDVQNGYLAVTKEALAALPLHRIETSYAFENWMLSQVSIHGFHVADVPMPAIYGDETSSLKIGRTIRTFPPKLLRLFLERLALRYVIFDLSPIALYLASGSLLMLFGTLFGAYHWWMSRVTGLPTLTGTVALALLPILLGFNLLLQAVDMDIRNSPKPRLPSGLPKFVPPWRPTDGAP